MVDSLGARLARTLGLRLAESWGTTDAIRDRVRELRADRAFRRRSRPALESTGDAPDHVVCVVVDALRADAVDPAVTPFLASLDGTAAVSPSTWTFPAVSSLLSGQYPHVHGAMRRSDGFENSVADMTPLPEPVADETPLLPDRLAAAGYDTYGAFGFVVPFLALAGRFRRHALHDDASADRLLADHEAWLADRREGRTFSYLHLSDLHEPVDPPPPYWRAHDVDRSIPGITGWRYEDVVDSSPTPDRYREHRRRLYRAAAEYVDNRLQAHLTRIADLAAGDVAVVVTADHGEGFWEHAAFDAARFADPRPAYCVGHGGAPYEAVVRVPLLTDGFAFEAGARPSLVDVAPTILDAVGVDPGVAQAGTSLLDSAEPDRPLLVEGVRYGYEKKAVYERERKLVVSRGDDVAVGFSLPDETPCELPAAVEAELADALPAWPDGERAAGTVSKDVENRLRRLGYT